MWDTADVCGNMKQRHLISSHSHPFPSSLRFSPELASQRAPDERDGHLHPGLLVGAGEGQRTPPGVPRLLPPQQLHLRPDHQGQQVGHGRDAHQTQ